MKQNKSPLIIRHRASTQAHIEQAFDNSIDGIEFDLRMTKDNVVVIHHDRRVVNADGRYFWIERVSYDELMVIEGERVYTLEQALVDIKKLMKKKRRKTIMLDIDIKQVRMERAVVKLLKTQHFDTQEIIVSSPNNFILNEFDKLLPSATFGMTYAFDKIDRWDLWNSMTMRAIFIIPFYSLKPFLFRLIRRRTSDKDIQVANLYYRLVSEQVVEFLHKNNIKVFVFGTNRPDRIERLIGLGVDGIKVR